MQMNEKNSYNNKNHFLNNDQEISDNDSIENSISEMTFEQMLQYEKDLEDN